MVNKKEITSRTYRTFKVFYIPVPESHFLCDFYELNTGKEEVIFQVIIQMNYETPVTFHFERQGNNWQVMEIGLLAELNIQLLDFIYKLSNK